MPRDVDETKVKLVQETALRECKKFFDGKPVVTSFDWGTERKEISREFFSMRLTTMPSRRRTPTPFAEAQREEIAKVLLKAADVIERDGWCQHNYRNGDAHCTYEAIAIGAGLDDGFALSDAESLVYRGDPSDKDRLGVAALARFEEIVGRDTCEWNNDVATGREDVVATLRKAAGK